MTTTPTLPATIPGLLLPCSPLLGPDGRTVAIGPVSDGRWVPVPGGELPADAVALDLTDPTGRAHAAWWLAGEPGAAWALDCDGYRRWTLSGGETPRAGLSRSFEGIGAEVRHMRQRSEPPQWGYDATDVPALDHLDPDDDRRLPDGSRWVDAEALRLVCLHVMGVSHG